MPRTSPAGAATADGGAFGAADPPDDEDLPGGQPEDDASSGERVHALVGQGRFAEAHTLVSDAFVERNGSAGYLLRAWVLTQERRSAAARESVDWALAIAGPAEAADVFVLAGVVLLSLDEAHAALTVALRAGGADPDGWEPSVLLSDVYRRLGRIPDAVVAARRAVAVAPYEAEAQVALARSLSATRGLLGRLPRRHRTEHESAVERAMTLGVDPGQLTAPRGGALVGGLGLALFWAVQLYRIETGDTWQLIAGGAVLAATAVLLAVLVRAGTRRSGVGARTRLRGIRATSRTELTGDDWLWRIGAVHVGALLPLPVLFGTGLVADRAWRGHDWPLWAAVTAAVAGLGGLLLTLLGVRWWYGAWLAGRMLRYGRLVPVQLGAVGLLAGTTLALTARGHTPRWEWAVLAVAHLGWAVVGWATALMLAARLQARRREML
ncbi:hypothetical protein [Actinacidiphila sp. ITFR-21]|uniref:hypothetical protein n=1 Tax=Actinacidiphila sp. ITFR-21 TaxID=3075199 RepID=UPI00288C1A3E|nr:hypothetical protein [Streptomyces sp. ITFR-21]WNI15736.1 hypothetical protein RLT57_09500 [Streptomyces sp. ITFR-21]